VLAGARPSFQLWELWPIFTKLDTEKKFIFNSDYNIKNIITIIISRRRETICVCIQPDSTYYCVNRNAKVRAHPPVTLHDRPISYRAYYCEKRNVYAFSWSDIRPVSLGSQTVLLVGGNVL
jgi:hypothetical protein